MRVNIDYDTEDGRTWEVQAVVANHDHPLTTELLSVKDEHGDEIVDDLDDRTKIGLIIAVEAAAKKKMKREESRGSRPMNEKLVERFDALLERMAPEGGAEVDESDANKLEALSKDDYVRAIGLAVNALLNRAGMSKERLDSQGAGVMRKRMMAVLPAAIRSQMSASHQASLSRQAVRAARSTGMIGT